MNGRGPAPGLEVELETDLLHRAQQGDYLAFEQLHARLEPAIARFVRRLLPDGQEGADVVQDTFLALYLHLREIDPPGNLRPYVFRIARNASYDVLRRHQRYAEVPLLDDDYGEPLPVRLAFDFNASGDLPPDEVTHWLLLKLEVQQAIDRLPVNQREVLLLYCEEEMTYEHIAAALEISVGTVKSRLFYARQTLRRIVRPEVLLALQSDPPATLPPAAPPADPVASEVHQLSAELPFKEPERIQSHG